MRDRLVACEMQPQKRAAPDELSARSALRWQGYLAAMLAMTVACAAGAASNARLSTCISMIQDLQDRVMYKDQQDLDGPVG